MKEIPICPQCHMEFCDCDEDDYDEYYNEDDYKEGEEEHRLEMFEDWKNHWESKNEK